MGLYRKELKAGIPLEEQARKRSWYQEGGITYSRIAVLDRIAKEVGGSDRKLWKLFKRAVHAATEFGAFEGPGCDWPWDVTRLGREIEVRFMHEEDLFKEILTGMLEATRNQGFNAAVVYAIGRKRLRQLEVLRAGVPDPVGENPDVAKRIKQEILQIEHRRNHVASILASRRKRGSPFDLLKK